MTKKIPLSPIATLALIASPLLGQQYDFAACAKYSEARNGHAVLVMQDGKVLFERYANGWSNSKAHRLASGTKSFAGTLLAIAVDDGFFGFDEKVSKTLVEWKSDPRKSQISYRQLLGLVSGLDGGSIGGAPSYSAAVASRTIAAPGKSFDYGPNPFQVFGEALKRKLAAQPRPETVTAYLSRRLITPLGMKVGFWRNANKGEPQLPSGLYLTAREWAKFGDMVASGGVYGSKRILATKHLRQCFVSTKVAPSYGVGWWLPPTNSPLPSDLCMAKGSGKQRLYVLPSKRLVVLRFGETLGRFSDIAFLSALMPATSREFGRGCRGSVGVPRLQADPTQKPIYGQFLSFGVSAIPTQAPGLYYLGMSKKLFGAIPLPLDLSQIGLLSCSLLVSPDISIPFLAQNGRNLMSFPLPRDNGLPGQDLYLQALVVDQGANKAGITLSNGLEVRVGLQ